MAPHLPLALELAGARLVGRASRAAGRGGGTTLPGKLLWRLDPGALDRLAARLPEGVALVSATNGKTTTTAMVAEILRGRALAHNAAGANLVSGVVSALVAARHTARLGLFEVDEAHLPEVARRVRPRALLLANLFRDQLDRYGELEQVAERWRSSVRDLPAGTIVVANADDPQVGSLAEGRATALRFGLDDPRRAGPLQHAADSKHCIRCGTPYDYAAAYVGHLGDYRCPNCGHARPELDVAARDIELDGLEGSRFTLGLPDVEVAVRLRLPGLYNVYNAVAASSLAHVLGASPEEIVVGLERFAAAFGRSERIDVGGKRLLVLLIKNPAGANEVVRTLLTSAEPPRHAVIALNDAIADGQDVSWIWDVDFEPLLAGLERIVASGERAAELALRLRYGGFTGELEVVPGLETALDRGLALTDDGAELVVLPTYTAMLALRRIVTERGFVRPYWEGERAS
jgi:UDP-N-acetylmuramyl tripeptide synthase